MERKGSSVIVLAAGLIVLAAALSLVFARFIDFRGSPSIQTVIPTSSAANQSGAGAGGLAFNPPKPTEAPQDLLDAVTLGYNLLTDTKKYAADYVGNDLNCSNCHFEAGGLQGGKNGGISLVGVAAVYPAYKTRQNAAVDLVTRTNDCFQRSMNGKPLAESSKEMVAILTYYKWIAKGVPIYADVPWLGLPAIKSNHKADANAGSAVFTQKCVGCHGKNGEGAQGFPPLWGNASFNDGAGMAKPATLATFAHLNMPKGNPTLTEEEALDVGEFVDTQPRPHFQSQ